MKLTIVGLGARKNDLSVGALEVMKKAERVILRNEGAYCAFLKEAGISFEALDDIYLSSRNFDTLAKNLANKVKGYLKTENVVYAVDGAVSEDASAKLLINSVKDVEIFEGVSKAKSFCALLKEDTINATIVSAYSVKAFKAFSLPLVIYDIDSRLLLSEWKLKLINLVGENAKVRLYVDNVIKNLPIYELDREDFLSPAICFVPKIELKNKERFTFDDLMEILRVLRSENGCPWDRAQTADSIKKNLIEECYELIDAINRHDDEGILEEAGDVLLQAAFQTEFLAERGVYNETDVVSALCTKLITRHTHIFGDENAKDAEAALSVWEKNKQTEKHYKNNVEYLLAVPNTLPAAMRAQKVVSRAIKKGFPVKERQELINDIKALLDDDKVSAAKLLFAAVVLAKLDNIDAEEALTDQTKLFIEEFKKL